MNNLMGALDAMFMMLGRGSSRHRRQPRGSADRDRAAELEEPMTDPLALYRGYVDAICLLTRVIEQFSGPITPGEVLIHHAIRHCCKQADRLLREEV